MRSMFQWPPLKWAPRVRKGEILRHPPSSNIDSNFHCPHLGAFVFSRPTSPLPQTTNRQYFSASAILCQPSEPRPRCTQRWGNNDPSLRHSVTDGPERCRSEVSRRAFKPSDIIPAPWKEASPARYLTLGDTRQASLKLCDRAWGNASRQVACEVAGKSLTLTNLNNNKSCRVSGQI